MNTSARILERAVHADLQAFLDSHPQWAAATWSAHRRWLETFLEIGDLAAYHQSLLWSSSATGRLYSPNTVDQALRAVRAFCRWAHRTGRRPNDPTKDLKLPRPTQPIQPVLDRAQMLALLNLPNLTNPRGLRDLVLLELLCYNQLSAPDCIALERADVHRLELEDTTANALTRYLACGRPLLQRVPTEKLLLTSRGRPFQTVGGVYAILRRYSARMGLPFNLSGQLLRRSWRHQIQELQRRHAR